MESLWGFGVTAIHPDSAVSFLHFAGDSFSFLAEFLLPSSPLEFSSKAGTFNNSGPDGRGSTLPPSWHHSRIAEPASQENLQRSQQQFSQVLDVPVSGLSFLTPFSVGLWKTPGLLPFAFIILKV